ncbi:MAG: LPS assembly lipoprotein LptE [Marinobacter sp.]|uniref:LPS-assembly lipoprotein LptE n=1 Tax=Marinobacter sp. TaxID=50741 RepID=UPI00299E7CFC|nr:LPS assembly lipoprotein LptE [Marinobacter sp.]MDX1635666.1 LPS assembly lipoprotein LptE [Marinobacter sp.]
MPATAALPIRSLLLAMSLALAGCGFQLRGQAPVPNAIEPLAVECSDSVPLALCESVRDQLALGDIKLVEPAEAAYLLRLDRFSEQRRASAITLQAAAAEYDLRQSVSLSVISADQVPLVAAAQVTSSDTYSYDEANVLAKRREEQEVRTDLYQRLAQQVIFRLAPLDSERIRTLRAAHQDDDSAPAGSQQ